MYIEREMGQDEHQANESVEWRRATKRPTAQEEWKHVKQNDDI